MLLLEIITQKILNRKGFITYWIIYFLFLVICSYAQNCISQYTLIHKMFNNTPDSVVVTLI